MSHKVNDTVYVIENSRNIQEMIIKSISGNLYFLKYKDRDGGYRVPRHRLFKSKEEAERNVAKVIKPPPIH